MHVFEAIQLMEEHEVVKKCKLCVEAIIQSTIAFDGIKTDRLVFANTHGTAHA